MFNRKKRIKETRALLKSLANSRSYLSKLRNELHKQTNEAIYNRNADWYVQQLWKKQTEIQIVIDDLLDQTLEIRKSRFYRKNKKAIEA